MKFGLLFAGLLCCFLLHPPAHASADPQLSIANTPGGTTVSWPAWAADWVLEAAPVLSPSPGSGWTSLSPQSYHNDGLWRSLTTSPQDGNRFYRLRKLDVAAAGPIGHWRLDEGSGQSSSDGNGSGATLFSANTTWAAGCVGPGALAFNGASAGAGGSRAWLSNTNFRVLPGPGRPFSVSLWFNPDAMTSGWRGIVGNASNSSNGWYVALHTSGPGTNDLVFRGGAVPTSLSVTGRTLLLPGQWYCLTVAHDGQQGNIYLDGALLANGLGEILLHEGPLLLGGGVAGFDSFLGRIDELCTYTNFLAPERASMVGEWSFDEGLGGLSADRTGRQYPARVTDPAAWMAGRQGMGIELSCGQVIIPNDDLTVLPPTGKPFSICFWLRPDSPATTDAALLSCGLANSNGWQLSVRAGASGRTDLHFDSTQQGGSLDLRAPVALSPGLWARIDLTYNGGIATIYVNGRRVQSGSGAFRSSRAPLVMGATTELPGFPGVLDELTIHSRELGESEIGPVAPVIWETVLHNTTTNIFLRGSGPGGKSLTYSLAPVVTPTNGTALLLPGASAVRYTAGARKGPDAFAYTVSDGEWTSPPAIVTVSVVEPHWLSPTGGVASPWDGSDAAHAWSAGTADSLDAIWKTNDFYDCFFYGPGEYQTRGWKYLERSTANRGCKHIGSGTEGELKTTIKLVDIWSAWGEETIFAPLYSLQPSDGFEVHQMVLDCNAQNVPKYTRGEPVWIRIPLAAPGLVSSVTLRWASKTIPYGFPTSLIGRAAEFSIFARRFGTNTFSVSATNSALVSVVPIGAEADELFLTLDRRAAGVGLYGLSEIEIQGGAASLPQATIPAGGESRLSSQYSVFMATDGNPGTAWASGVESQAQVELPLDAGTAVSQVNLDWNCQSVSGFGHLGPASAFTIAARDPNSGLYASVPFVRHPRTASGTEAISFGTAQSTNVVVTDRLRITLISREPSVDYYSLNEIRVQNGPAPVSLRQPASLNSFGGYSILRAFDQDSATEWASGTQGMVGAIAAWGNNLKFTHLKVVGFGTKVGRECFVMFLATPQFGEPARAGNVLVENCVFMNSATNNSDGLSVVALAGNPTIVLTNAVIRSCTFSGLRPYFLYSQAMGATHIENCLVMDCSRSVYFEPDPAGLDVIEPVLIRSNRFINVDSGVYVATHPSAHIDSIACLDNEIVLAGRNGWGVAICDTCYVGQTATATNVTVLNNIIRYPDWAARPTSPDGGIYYSDIHHAVFGNNVVALGTAYSVRVRDCPAGLVPPPLGDCEQFAPFPPPPSTYPPCLDSLPAGYRRAWFGNRDLNGALLPVRFRQNGSDGLSSQQQWPQ
jgi:hypothetical protein